jgi:O-antigen ligase
MQLRNRLTTYYPTLFSWCILLFPLLALFISRVANTFFPLLALIPCLLWFYTKPWPVLYRPFLERISCCILGFCFISLIWTLNPSVAFVLWLQIVILYWAAHALFYHTQEFTSSTRLTLLRFLHVGLWVALLVANIEILSDGYITRSVRSLLQADPDYIYSLVDLNRGSVVLSLLSWPVLYFLCRHRYYILGTFLLIIILGTLLRLESQSASCAFILGLIVGAFIFITGRTGIYILIGSLTLLVALVPVIALYMDPMMVFDTIPTPSHAAPQMRLHIWHYSALKAALHPWLGWGLDASRHIPVPIEDYVLNGRHPLPLHPHNNILQVWLELGIVGLILFYLFIAGLLKRIASYTHPLDRAFAIALMTAFFSIGATGYGIWQHWFISSGLIATALFLVAQGYFRDKNKLVD